MQNKMIAYFEFSDTVVNRGVAPAKLCSMCNGFACETIDGGFTFEMGDMNRAALVSFADRIYIIKENILIDIKNRISENGTTHISDEDKVVLKLRAVLI